MINEVGNRYGKLTVIEQSNERINGHIKWICKCDCGNLCEVDGTHLRNGSAKSCGCYAKEISSLVHRINEIGNKYGKLTVLYCDTEKTEQTRRVFWKCKCDCGNIISVSSSNLRAGNVQSCGCLRSSGEEKINSILQ